MISKDKQYRTRDGREVRIYATDGAGNHAVHGSIKMNDGWRCTTWQADGLVIAKEEHCADLIEVKPRIRRTFWMNVYPENDIRPYEDKYVADACETLRNVMGVETRRIACVKVEIDCEEGEGL